MGQGQTGWSPTRTPLQEPLASPPADPSCGWESHMAKQGMGTKEDKRAIGPKEALASSVGAHGLKSSKE